MIPFWRKILEQLSTEEATQQVQGRPVLVLTERGEAVEYIAFSACGEGDERGIWVFEAAAGPYRRLHFYPLSRVAYIDLEASPQEPPEKWP